MQYQVIPALGMVTARVHYVPRGSFTSPYRYTGRPPDGFGRQSKSVRSGKSGAVYNLYLNQL